MPTVTDLSQGGVWSLISHSGPVVQLVLLILVMFSVASWAIILSKHRTLSHARGQSEEFLDAFWKNQRLDALYEKSERWIDSPVSKVFRAGYRELSRLHDVVVKAEAGVDVAAAAETSILQNVSRAMSRARNLETTRLERALTFLATTGSATPFIGLFGTVWGIMNAFRSIGLSGAASLAVVAPGISEALIATAVGLAAAIPAVIAYNAYLRRVETLTIEMENFSDEFMNLVDRFYAAR
ncbi:MAG: protein TolQ [Nitrospinota bacterium]|nr:protein TolQ [Nitrospinota bacterium]MDP6619215.1 protein TolQ [Nitrospinota bacterium]HJM43956.1 protein TolQ [Nitrospinota bacterium]